MKLEMKKENKFYLKIHNQLGQISIFFSTTIFVLITFMAFIINIGIFVKAKINLQNATDAAAYAGASVQARQLTNIAYLNWEMRNVYKQWMFKYYVLGGLALKNVAGGNPGQYMDFTMESYTRTSTDAEDFYNFPSVCIDFASTGGVGLCTKYLIPGLPRFESSNVLGMDETTNAFIDTIVQEKARNCSDRTALNFFTANTWAYNVKTNDPALSNITEQSPEIAAGFMGAFPEAFELAIRIRNLEYEVNTPPAGSICVNPGVGVDCTTNATSLNTPGLERALKAFTTGYRNIGKNGNDGQDNRFKQSYTLREVSPTLYKPNDIGLMSNLLIPPDKVDKYYLDLQLMPINYATFYTGFTSGVSGSDGQLQVDSLTVNTEGQCSATKMGLPVPGYPLGFVKNPDVLTYYAVEGKAKFTGLFNPFDAEIVLTTYAAAKPFGGRIGPALFDLSDGKYLKSRNDLKSSSFLSALDTASFRGTFGGGTSGEYKPGMPIPINAGSGIDKFWQTDESDTVGGWVTGAEIFYGVPNLVWDYPNGNLTNKQTFHSNRNVQVIARNGDTPTAGLYNKDTFERFKSYLNGIGGVVDTGSIEAAINMAKAPTQYEVHNYLVPTPEDLNRSLGVDSWGAISSGPTGSPLTDGSGNSYTPYKLRIYAPLYSPHSLYTESSAVVGAFSNYIDNQEQAILKYQSSMNLVAADIFNNNNSQATGQNTGESAARALSDLLDSQYAAIGSDSSKARDPSMLPSCQSIVGKFIYFYTGKADKVSDTNPDATCPASLSTLLQARWGDTSLTQDVYEADYFLPNNLQERFFTAYRPGSFHGVNAATGAQSNPIGPSPEKMIRNYYSTKLVPFRGVSSNSDATYGLGKMRVYSEGDKTGSTNAGLNRKAFLNPIDPNEATVDINSTSH